MEAAIKILNEKVEELNMELESIDMSIMDYASLSPAEQGEARFGEADLIEEFNNIKLMIKECEQALDLIHKNN